MIDVINVQEKTIPILLDQIQTIKYILPSKFNQVIFIGYSKDSVKNMQFIYEFYDYQEQITKTKGRISTFGIFFLSQYVLYQNQGQFLILIQSLGSRKIIKENFMIGVTTTIIKDIQKQEFQKEAKKQWHCIHYSSNHKKIYLLEISEFSHQQNHILFRVFSNNNLLISTYRLICIDGQKIPKIIFSPQHILCLSEDHLIIYKQNFQQIYFNINSDNLSQFKILGFFYQMILQFKQDNSIFSMSMNGTLKPLLEESVVSFHINQSFAAFLYLEKQQNNFSYKLAIFQYKNGNFVKLEKHKISIMGKPNFQAVNGKISQNLKIFQSNKHQILINGTQN